MQIPQGNEVSAPEGSAVNGRRVLITGAGSGIGMGVATRLARRGSMVAMLDVNANAVQRAAKAISDAGGRAIGIATDVRSEDSVRAAVTKAAEAFDGLDTVVAAAGVIQFSWTHEMPVEMWDKVMGINLRGVFLTVKHTIPHLLNAGGGAIVTVGSISSFVAGAPISAYDASKGGLLLFTKAVAVEYAGHGIRANCVCPGAVTTGIYVNSELVTGSFNAAAHRPRPSDRFDVPMARAAAPDEIAAAVEFLCSDDAGFITGASLAVDGGYTAV